jgi:hypothetical protein
MYFFNLTTSNIFRDERMRRALSVACDRDGLIQEFGNISSSGATTSQRLEQHANTLGRRRRFLVAGPEERGHGLSGQCARQVVPPLTRGRHSSSERGRLRWRAIRRRDYVRRLYRALRQDGPEADHDARGSRHPSQTWRRRTTARAAPGLGKDYKQVGFGTATCTTVDSICSTASAGAPRT